MNPMLVRNVLFPAFRWLRGDDRLKKADEFIRNQWLSADELAALQWKKFKNLLNHAYENVPYYHAVFKEVGITPTDIKEHSDLGLLPILTKEKIRAHRERLLAKNIPREALIPNATSGSTGQNLHFFQTRPMKDASGGSTYRFHKWCGLKIADKTACLWGAPIDLKKTFVNRIKEWFLNTIWLSSFDLTAISMQQYAERLQKFKPKIIIAYPTPLSVFALYLKDHKIHISPDAIICSSETLYPYQRELIEETFGCKIFNRYGSREFGDLAMECEKHAGLHVATDRFLPEFIKDGRPAKVGEVGEILVTDLDNWGMPFIRYQIGDLGVPTDRQCACGRGLPLIESIEGRTFDMIHTPQGKSLGGTFWTILLRSVAGIDAFQVRQSTLDGIRILIKTNNDFKAEYLDPLRQKIAAHCGDSFQVDFEIVTQIPLTKSGKRRFIISEINQDLK
jgi:phenylacetate-CoA ligase